MKFKFLLFVAILFSATIAQAQIKTPQLSPHAKVEQVIGLTNVTIDYSRPSMRGRKIFGSLVPYKKKWRTGANANTTITFDTDVTISGMPLKKGTYAVYTIPDENFWQIFFYNDVSNWGLPKEWSDNKIALRVSSEVVKTPFTMETFSIGIDDLAKPDTGTLYFMWENTMVTLKIKVPTDKIAMMSIEQTLSGTNITAKDYATAATYYRTTGKDLNKASQWIAKAVAMQPEAYWFTREQSLILAKKGDKNAAIVAAEKSLEAAKKAGNQEYIRMNKESIAEWLK